MPGCALVCGTDQGRSSALLSLTLSLSLCLTVPSSLCPLTGQGSTREPAVCSARAVGGCGPLSACRQMPLSLAEVRRVLPRLYCSSDGTSIQLDLDDETGLRVALLQVQPEVMCSATVRNFHCLEERSRSKSSLSNASTCQAVPKAFKVVVPCCNFLRCFVRLLACVAKSVVSNKSVYSPPVACLLPVALSLLTRGGKM